MTDTITITGFVATDPRHLITSEGLPITSFRLASTQRRYDRAQKTWVDGETNWFTVTAFRQLALNGAISISKSQRVIVTGRLRIRQWQNAEKTGTTVEIEAEGIGHDLGWGTAAFTRSVTANSTSPEPQENSDEAFPSEFAPSAASSTVPPDEPDDATEVVASSTAELEDAPF